MFHYWNHFLFYFRKLDSAEWGWSPVGSLRHWITSPLVGFPDLRRVNWAVTFPFVFLFLPREGRSLVKSLRHWIISQYVLQIWAGLIELSHFTQASNIGCTKYQIQNSCQDILGPLQKWFFTQDSETNVKLCTHQMGISRSSPIL